MEELKYDKELLIAFLRDLRYCLEDDEGNIDLGDDDTDFFVDAFLESSDYEDFKNKMKNN